MEKTLAVSIAFRSLKLNLAVRVYTAIS